MYKKLLFIFTLLLNGGFIYAQQSSPSYIDVVRTFCKSYQPLDDYENSTRFAKKKKGWYVTQVNTLQADRLLSEKLFFSFAENKYLDLGTTYTKATAPDMDKLLGGYLNLGGSIIDWYNFERSPYYGYNGWYLDVIRELGSRNDLTDTLYDVLGRAYSGLASSYLWYQFGGMFPEYDTLHRKLERLEQPSAQRIDSIRKAFENTSTQFEKLNKKNPAYLTIVGNSTLKLFNEYMYEYNQMLMCGRADLAKQYLEKAQLPGPYITQAKNYLNSCEPNAILITYGDNDTYQLWYTQEKFGYRKDVLVINNSLLGLPVYVDMLKKNNSLIVSTPSTFLEDQSNDVVYYQENEKISGTSKDISLKELLSVLYKKKYPYRGEDYPFYPTYPYSRSSFNLPVSWNKTAETVPLQKLYFDLSDQYYLVNDVVIFDIIVNNILKRPLYFTSRDGNIFEKNLAQTGLTYKLIAGDLDTELHKSTEIRILERFINEKYVPVVSNDSGFVSYDGDNTFFYMHYKIFDHYIEKKDITGLKKWLDKFSAVCRKPLPVQMQTGRYLSYYFIEAGDSKQGLALTDQFAQWLHDVYSNPVSLNGFYSKESYIDELTKTRDYLSSKKLKSALIDRLLKE